MRVLREGPVKITKATIEAAWRRRAKDQRLVIGDANCRGLALLVNTASMAWTYSYKPRGSDPATGKRFSTRSVTIGNPETHSPEDARTAANALKGQTKAGEDPAAQRRAKIKRAAADRGRTLSRLLEDYEKALPLRPKLRGTGALSPRGLHEELSNAKAAVADMKAGERAVAEVDANDLRVMLRANVNKPGAARHRFGAVSRFFDWAQEEGFITVNPCTLIPKARRPKAVAARHRVLALEELARIWKAAGQTEDLEPVHRDFIRFVVAIPCRRGEAATLDWSHLDLAAGTWSQPSRLTKNRDPHRLHLHPLALDLLLERHRAAGEPKRGLVFPAPESKKALATFSKFKGVVAEKAEIVDWRMHDARRSFATALGEAGVAEPVVDAVLNHRQSATRGGVLGVYQRAQRWPEQVKAMQVWGDLLAAAVEGRQPGEEKVVPLRPAEGAA